MIRACYSVIISFFNHFSSFSYSKLAASFQSMEVRNSNFAAFIDIFTSNTYVMVVMSDPSIRKFKLSWPSFKATYSLNNCPRGSTLLDT